MIINIDMLRDDLRDECLGAYFAGGYGAALLEVRDIENASPQELINIAQRLGKNICAYQEED